MSWGEKLREKRYIGKNVTGRNVTGRNVSGRNGVPPYSGFKCILWVAVDLLNIEEFFKKNCFSKDTDFYLSFLQFHDVL